MRRLFAVFLAAAALAGSTDAHAFNHRHSVWAKVLKKYVRDGLVDYASLKENSGSLDDYLVSVSQVKESDYRKWSQTRKIAFWINAYNALAIRAVLDRYPPERRFGWRGLAFPSPSIQQIPHVWKDKRIFIMEVPMSLDDIEYGMLGKEFREPRVHFALVCASAGCPRLRSEPYLDGLLNQQLQSQFRAFASDPAKLHYDDQTDQLFLSPIFKWFGDDFKEEGGVIAFIHKNLPDRKTADRLSQKTKIRWLPYDWKLNDRRP